jgi:putative Holliday junction resolvase
MRILGMDWGSVRVGVAMSDEEQKLAFPLQYSLESKKAIEELKKLIKDYEIEKIVLGLPISLKGTPTDSTIKTKQFAERLEKELAIKIEFVDERFSSVESGKSLQQQEIREKDQRQIKDNIAAALMLQQYLDIKNK